MSLAKKVSGFQNWYPGLCRVYNIVYHYKVVIQANLDAYFWGSELRKYQSNCKHTRLNNPPRPPEFPPPMAPLNFDCTKSFITVIAAPLTASCLLPDAAPPALSNNFVASAIARLMSCVLLPPPPPPVNCFNAYKRKSVDM